MNKSYGIILTVLLVSLSVVLADEIKLSVSSPGPYNLNDPFDIVVSYKPDGNTAITNVEFTVADDPKIANALIATDGIQFLSTTSAKLLNAQADSGNVLGNGEWRYTESSAANAIGCEGDESCKGTIGQFNTILTIKAKVTAVPEAGTIRLTLNDLLIHDDTSSSNLLLQPVYENNEISFTRESSVPDAAGDGGGGKVFSCTGDIAHSTLCEGDNGGLAADTSGVLVAACTDAKCEYICSDNFLLQEGACVPESSDTDSDGVSDDTDNCLNVANPAVDGVQADADGDGVGDACEDLPSAFSVSSSTVVGANVEITFSVTGAQIGADGNTPHIHVGGVMYYLNGAITQREGNYLLTIPKGGDGEHTITLELVQAGHSSYTPAITAQAGYTVGAEGEGGEPVDVSTYDLNDDKCINSNDIWSEGNLWDTFLTKLRNLLAADSGLKDVNTHLWGMYNNWHKGSGCA